jgi:hypothetical protein
MIDTLRKIAAANPPRTFVMEVSEGFLTLQLGTEINHQRAIVRKKQRMIDLPDKTPAQTDNFICDIIDGMGLELDQAMKKEQA